MSDKRRVAGAAGAAIGLGAFAALFGACCVAPWVVGLLGFGAAAVLARLSFLQPYLIGGTLGLLATAFWWAYRPRPACAADNCANDGRRSLRRMAWLACAIVCGLGATTWLQLHAG
jgi:hypothetical protein